MKDYLAQIVRAAPTPVQGRNVAREYLQARKLGALQRAGAMVPLAFHGGTALRFLFASARYSEDLDFALEQATAGYDFRTFLQAIRSTFSAEGYQVELKVGDHKTVQLDAIAQQAREFVLQHHLFRSDRTGQLINPRFLLLSYPSRWFYDILRALDYFRSVGAGYDPRLQDALDVLMQKRRRDGTWPLQAKHAGQVHFDIETPGQPSRWNTLRALRVLKQLGVARSPYAPRQAMPDAGRSIPDVTRV